MAAAAGTPDPIRPMLASDGAMPSGSRWAFEFVWDGLRTLAYLEPGRARLYSATGRSITASYPELGALAGLTDRHGPLVLDGKIIALDQLRRPSARLLRKRMSNASPSAALLRRIPVRFYLLDLLRAEGDDLTDTPYQRRRELLGELDLSGVPAQLPPYFVDTDGQTVLHEATRHGLAGVVAKRLDSRYQPGRRSRAWVQTLPRHTQQVVVGGWQPGENGELAALLVGVPDRHSLRFLARVSSGFTPVERRELTRQLAELAQPDCSFGAPPESAGQRDTHWVSPRLVGEISYRRPDPGSRPRQASWQRLRPTVHPAGVGAAPWLTVSDEVVITDPVTGPNVTDELAMLNDAVRLAQAELRAERARISQHFLYNVLTTIASYTRTDPPRARELLLDFAEYTRYSFRGEQISTLGAELANVDRYLALECARFGERLTVKRDVAEGLEDVPLPFLAVQQLVEAAVRHGIEGMPRGGTVTVTAAPLGAECVVTLSEDATAVPDGRAPSWLTEALSDVRDRLRAAPGPPAALDVSLPADGGTMVTLRLPRPQGRLDA